MEIKLKKACRSAFGDLQTVYVKVLRDKPGYRPWERVLDDFQVEKMDAGFPGNWSIYSFSDDTDKYMLARFGKMGLYFKTRADLIKVITQIVQDRPAWDYSGGRKRPFVYA